MMFANVALGVRREVFDAELDAAKSRLGVTTDREVPAAELRKLTAVYKNIVSERTGRAFPQDVKEQLRLAINAVFDSWFAKKSAEYRRIHNVPEEWGTAVTVMAMVFGNLGETSGTGEVSEHHGHHGHRDGHGVRKPRRDLGDGRRLHARSTDRRTALLRRGFRTP